MKRIAVVIGTRPEAIKMAPVVRAIAAQPDMEVRVWSTGQHREMLDQALGLFGIAADRDLAIMRPDQPLNQAFSSVVAGVDGLIAEERPDWILVHGDTSSAAAAATGAFYAGIPVGHVEAGLRSGRLDQPWPEEFNRRLADLAARLHFAPTAAARANLLAEGFSEASIIVTGNTVVDALVGMIGAIEANPSRRADLDARYGFLDASRPLVLVTGHRRESFGDGFARICDALGRLDESGAAEILYPVHLNPNVLTPVHARLSGRRGVHLVEPVDYETFVYLMQRSSVILTDSGGVQEEAPTLGKPVLVMREVTERPEAVEAGTARLVGTSPTAIVEGVLTALEAGPSVPRPNPYGDGQAARRIVEGLRLAADALR